MTTQRGPARTRPWWRRSGHADLAFIGRARLRVRTVVLELSADTVTDLPAWATRPIPDGTVDLVNAWASVAGSREEAPFLTDHAAELATAELADTLAAMAALYLDNPILPRAQAVVAAIGAGNFDEVHAALAGANEAMAVVREWMATLSWPASRAYFEANRESLLSDSVAEVLAAWADQDGDAAQHLALLRLAQYVAVPDLFDAVADDTDAVDLVNDIIGLGQAALVGRY